MKINKLSAPPKKFGAALLFIFFAASHSASAARIKDIVTIKGVRENQLMGYGLVVGLKGTGDSKKEFTSISMTQMLRQMGVDVKTDASSNNVAAVVVTGNLPPFARVGSKLDVLVNSIGDAKSLQGGTLLMTPLKGGDKAVYAVAQGSLSLGGLSEGGSGSGPKAYPTIAKIPDGASVEREVQEDFSNRNALRLSLRNPDFTTAARLAKTINRELGGIFARARDAATIDVMIPYDFEGGVVELLAAIEKLPVEQDNKARIVINERTGTIIVGDAVRISSVAIAQGNLTLQVKAEEARAGTERATLMRDVAGEMGGVKEAPFASNTVGDKLVSVREGATLGAVVKALNAVGITPKDLIGILQALKAQGALQADLEIL